MTTHYRTEGFIFKKTERGEADFLFTIFTKDFGKIEVLGKGIRKISSKLRAGAQLFYFSEIEFVQGKIYKTLTDAILIDRFKNIRENLKKLELVYRITEIFDDLVKEEEKDLELWEFLKDLFDKMNNLKTSPISYQIVYQYFAWNLLSVLGYRPEIYNCAICQKKLIPEKLYFSAKDGGIICYSCYKKEKNEKADSDELVIREISPDLVKILRMILEKKWEFILKLKIKPSYQTLLKVILKDFLFCILPSEKNC